MQTTANRKMNFLQKPSAREREALGAQASHLLRASATTLAHLSQGLRLIFSGLPHTPRLRPLALRKRQARRYRWRSPLARNWERRQQLAEATAAGARGRHSQQPVQHPH